MNMPTVFAKFLERNSLRRQNADLLQRTKLLTSQVRAFADIQATTDITTNTDTSSLKTYTGNPYPAYADQVTKLANMYDNKADWGCVIAKNVIDVRIAFSVGAGITVKKREEYQGSAEAELAWVKEFMRFNNLDEEMPQEYAKEAEIEGKILFRFGIDEAARQIRLIHVPWRKFAYTITTPEYSLYDYVKASYSGSSDPAVNFNLDYPLFVYKRFGGTSTSTLAGNTATLSVTHTPPKAAFVIRQMEDLDKAMVDWRKINRLFAAPTPWINGPDKTTAKEISEWIEASNWRIGKLLVTGGQDVSFDLIGWKGDGYTTMKFEIQDLAKIISGTTGVPVHFLGHPDLLSNRDTAEDLSKLMELSTIKERLTWIGAYEEVFQKAMVIYNTVFDASLNPMAVDATIERNEALMGIVDETANQGGDTSAQSDGAQRDS